MHQLAAHPGLQQTDRRPQPHHSLDVGGGGHAREHLLQVPPVLAIPAGLGIADAALICINLSAMTVPDRERNENGVRHTEGVVGEEVGDCSVR
jgi:hypothetical protein